VALLTVAALSLALAPHGTNTLRLRVGQHALTVSLHKAGSAPGGEAAADASGEAAAEGGAAGGGGQAAEGPLPCERSGYCSLGKTRVWRGDVAANDALRQMLEAVSFKKEVPPAAHPALAVALPFDVSVPVPAA
jgi:hypothetical protein